MIMTLRKGGSSWAVEDKREPHSVELYDLVADPGCTHNLVEEEFARAARMRKQLIEWLGQASPTKLSSSSGQRKASADADLQALGYGGADEDPAPSSSWYTPDPNSEWVQRFEEFDG